MIRNRFPGGRAANARQLISSGFLDDTPVHRRDAAAFLAEVNGTNEQNKRGADLPLRDEFGTPIPGRRDIIRSTRRPKSSTMRPRSSCGSRQIEPGSRYAAHAFQAQRSEMSLA